MSDTAATTESKTSTDEQSFLSRLTAFGDEIIAAERPVVADVPKVLGALIHWVDQGGGFEAPESFNPALSEAVAEQEAEQSRLAAANADMAKRLESLETLMRQQIAASGTVPAAPIIETPTAPTTATGADTPSPVTPSEGAAPVAPAPAPASGDVVPGVTTQTTTVTAPAEAAPDPAAAAPVPPVVSE